MEFKILNLLVAAAYIFFYIKLNKQVEQELRESKKTVKTVKTKLSFKVLLVSLIPMLNVIMLINLLTKWDHIKQNVVNNIIEKL